MPLENCSSSWLSKSKEKRFLNVVFFAFCHCQNGVYNYLFSPAKSILLLVNRVKRYQKHRLLIF